MATFPSYAKTGAWSQFFGKLLSDRIMWRIMGLAQGMRSLVVSPTSKEIRPKKSL